MYLKRNSAHKEVAKFNLVAVVFVCGTTGRSKQLTTFIHSFEGCYNVIMLLEEGGYTAITLFVGHLVIVADDICKETFPKLLVA